MAELLDMLWPQHSAQTERNPSAGAAVELPVLCERKLQGAAWQSSSPRLVPAAFVPRRGAVPGRKGHPGLQPWPGTAHPLGIGAVPPQLPGDTPVASGTSGPPGSQPCAETVPVLQLFNSLINSLSSSCLATDTAKDSLAGFPSTSY